MEPRIQYAKTSDGVNIAYASAGEGPELLIVSPPPFCHVQLDWQATFSFLYQPLAEKNRLFWFAWPGTGLSDRDSFNFSMDSLVANLESVVEQAGLSEFAIAAFATGVHIAVTYAVSHQDRVTHLALGDGYTTDSEYQQTELYKAEKALRDKDWVIYTESYARMLLGFDHDEFAREIARYLRECVQPDAMRASFDAREAYDISKLLSRVAAPTLVVQNQRSTYTPVQSGRRPAAGIRNSRFVLVDDPTYSQLPALIQEFLGGQKEVAPALPSGMTAILFTDIAQSTALTERLGDAAFRARARDLDRALRSVIRDRDGTAIEGKLLGDGVLAVFTSARQAIETALACCRAGDDAGLPLHLGLHAGDVIREEGNVYGGAVNIAARISGLSAPGEVLVSETVRSLARTSAGVRFEDRGEQALKGVGEPVRVWAVRAD